MFSTNFVAATAEYTTLTHPVPAPYLRKTFMVEAGLTFLLLATGC